MRTTLNVDEALVGRATRLSGLREKTGVVRAGLEALVARAPVTVLMTWSSRAKEQRAKGT